MDCSPAVFSVGFPRQEYWSGFPRPPPGDLPAPGIEPMSLTSPALVGWFFTTSTSWEALRVRLLKKYIPSSQRQIEEWLVMKTW